MPALPPNRPGCTTVRRARPLPDPEAVRLCLIPDPAPPFDGEAPATGPGEANRTRDASVALEAGKQPAGAGQLTGPEHSGAGRADTATPGGDGAGMPDGWLAPDVAAAQTAGGTEQRSTDGARPGQEPAWPSRFAQVLAETLAGSRHPRQIAPWTTQRARDHIQRLGAQMSSAQRPRVRRVIVFNPTADVVEMSVVVGFGHRVRALAVRLEQQSPGPVPRHHQEAPTSPRWLCTAVEAA
jgi:hypothetical protein